MKQPSSTFGVVSVDITTDLPHCINAACTIALAENNCVTHYLVGPFSNGYSLPNSDNEPACDSLYLCWRDHPGSTALPYPITTAAELSALIINWLRTKADYPFVDYGSDMTEERGVRIRTVDGSGVTLVATPEHVYYGK